ncbi:MAG TPA: tetratricopeptide repeat protein [Gammaproteobacteria bacterium]|nr:tetratricopeptide repeat protein [Gammaproteobacteria bacterium]
MPGRKWLGLLLALASRQGNTDKCRASLPARCIRQYHLVGVLMVAGLFVGCAATGPQEIEEKSAENAESAGPAVDPAASAAFDAALQAMANGKDVQAEKILLTMTQDFPQFSGPHANLGIIYFRAGKRDKAETAFLRAVEIKPENAVSLDYLGVINRDKGQFKEAAGFYQRAIKADPKYAYAYRNYGILLELYMGKLKQALAQYEKYQKLSNGEDKQVAKWIVDLSRRSGVKK